MHGTALRGSAGRFRDGGGGSATHGRAGGPSATLETAVAHTGHLISPKEDEELVPRQVQ